MTGYRVRLSSSGWLFWSMESSSNCGTRGYFFMGYWNGGYFDHCSIICRTGRDVSTSRGWSNIPSIHTDHLLVFWLLGLTDLNRFNDNGGGYCICAIYEYFGQEMGSLDSWRIAGRQRGHLTSKGWLVASLLLFVYFL